MRAVVTSISGDGCEVEVLGKTKGRGRGWVRLEHVEADGKADDEVAAKMDLARSLAEDNRVPAALKLYREVVEDCRAGTAAGEAAERVKALEARRRAVRP